jgi:hypothetical protein
MQLVAYGAQDVYLTGNPQITFWKVTYRRHTNFAMESIEQTFNGQCDFGKRVQCTISRNGDLAYRTYLQVTLPEIEALNGNASLTEQNNGGIVAPRWLDYPGEHLISMVEVEIGGQRIDRQFGDWMHIWNQLTLTAEAKRGYDQMVGHTTQLTYLANANGDDPDRPCGTCNTAQTCEIRNALPETTLYVPLQFWFCRNPGMALPLIALQYHEVKITLELRPIQEMLWAVTAASSGPATGMPTVAAAGSSKDQKNPNAYKVALVAASLYVDYIFLDTDERRRMAQNPHEYLIEQVQFTGDESIGSSSNRIKLNFNHPVKELIWVVQPDCHVDYCGSTYGCDQTGANAPSCSDCGCEGPLFSAHGAQPFNYTDAADVLPNSVFNYVPLSDANTGGFVGEPDTTYCDEILNGAYGGGYAAGNVPGACEDGGAGSGVVPGDDDDGKARAGYVSTALGVVAAQVALDRHCWGSNPVVTAKLQLNGQDRFSEREGTYFDLVQPYQHHTRNPDTGINVYSFALRPEEHQPSGTANFSRIDSANLVLVVSANTVTGSKTAKVRVYAVNYNVLRVMSGMGGLAYSN